MLIRGVCRHGLRTVVFVVDALEGWEDRGSQGIRGRCASGSGVETEWTMTGISPVGKLFANIEF
jgi:hypothetical protein